MDCPVCSKIMIAVERNKIELDYCIICKGFWFDESELELLIKTLDIKFDINDIQECSSDFLAPEKTRKCPRCSDKMEKVLLGYTLVDKCPNKHGLWFDAGELGALLGQYSMPELQDEPQETKIVRFLGEVFSVKIS